MRIDFESGDWIQYLYDASGVKHQTKHYSASNGITITKDYISNKIYENNVLKTILTSEGYVEKNGNQFDYFYYLKDHLGNNRVVMNSAGTAVQVNNYYAFGLNIWEGATNQSSQPYKFNGKELDKMHGLNMYDYSARMYDPAIGRFSTMDPLAEKYYSVSPYAYCNNNPVNAIDPDGRFVMFLPLAIPVGKIVVAGVAAGITSYLAYRALKGVKEIVDSHPRTSSTTSFEKTEMSRTQDAISPEYNHQRKRERESKEQQDVQQANVAKSVDTNISGDMPNGDPAPKRDPNDGGKKTKVAVVVTSVGLGAATVESVVEGTKTPETKVPKVPETTKIPNQTPVRPMPQIVPQEYKPFKYPGQQ